jgi:AcrR family transcriptional regulator
MPTRPAPRRLSRAEAQAVTRGRLLRAAAEVFAAKGFHAATLTDVADQAGYSIGAVYSNFASKDALFQGLMQDRIRAVEASLAAALPPTSASSPGRAKSIDVAIESELDRLENAEDAVPAGWWRLLAEFRAYAADKPEIRRELAASDRRCRDLIADHIDRFATDIGIRLPMTPTELAELTNALSDGLRAAHAEGRTTITPGAGLRSVVAAMLESARRDTRSSDRAAPPTS